MLLQRLRARSSWRSHDHALLVFDGLRPGGHEAVVAMCSSCAAGLAKLRPALLVVAPVGDSCSACVRASSSALHVLAWASYLSRSRSAWREQGALRAVQVVHRSVFGSVGLRWPTTTRLQALHARLQRRVLAHVPAAAARASPGQTHGGVEFGVVAGRVGAELDQVARLVDSAPTAAGAAAAPLPGAAAAPTLSSRARSGARRRWPGGGRLGQLARQHDVAVEDAARRVGDRVLVSSPSLSTV